MKPIELVSIFCITYWKNIISSATDYKYL